MGQFSDDLSSTKSTNAANTNTPFPPSLIRLLVVIVPATSQNYPILLVLGDTSQKTRLRSCKDDLKA
jgi:hypothetical protein